MKTMWTGMQQSLFPDCFVRGANGRVNWVTRGAVAAVLSLLLLIGASASSFAAPRAGVRSHVKVYLMRGFMNVFSLGMDEMANDLEQRGIPADAYNHLLWGTLASEAVADYKSGRTKTIILVGHSMGGDAVVNMVEALGNAGVPVALAVTLDISPETITAGRVNNFVNLYISTGALKAGPGFHGRMTNIDISKKLSVDHMTIEKNLVVQKMVVNYINQAIGSGQ
jgi:pimeloyl-ACP methyl ester carboxylesterase